MTGPSPPAAFDVDAYLRREREAVARALEEEAVAAVEDELPPDLARAAAAALRAPGKRLRPILCVTAYRAVGGESDAIYRLAVALEMIHTYSLMHDDLPCMDDAELRRGRPATHRVHGEEATMVAGAALIPLAHRVAWDGALAVGVPSSRARRIVAELAVASGARGMVGGQVVDLVSEGERLDGAELDELHERKTGALLAASLTLGGLAAGADDDAVAALSEFGRRIGLAFQIVDDILDATAGAEALGKVPARDAALEKATYVSVHGLDEARRRADVEAAAAREELDEAGIASPALGALARYVVQRRR